ncbi:MAG: hypothetical protein QME51_10755, partial [Planctomycetota bacterium]|nr:hypothetical protein [Planctomycetota bacterium]
MKRLMLLRSRSGVPLLIAGVLWWLVGVVIAGYTIPTLQFGSGGFSAGGGSDAQTVARPSPGSRQ